MERPLPLHVCLILTNILTQAKVKSQQWVLQFSDRRDNIVKSNTDHVITSFRSSLSQIILKAPPFFAFNSIVGHKFNQYGT